MGAMCHVIVGGDSGRITCLVVEPARAVEAVEELAVCLAAPEVHARDLEVAPDCVHPVRVRA